MLLQLNNIYRDVEIRYFILYIISGSLVILYENIKLILNKYNVNKSLLFLEGNYLQNKYITIDKWYFTHLIFYSILGYLYPNTFYLSMFIGIIWELFESYLGLYKPLWFFKNNKNNSSNSWHGRISDIFVNSIGFLIGSNLRFII